MGHFLTCSRHHSGEGRLLIGLFFEVLEEDYAIRYC